MRNACVCAWIVLIAARCALHFVLARVISVLTHVNAVPSAAMLAPPHAKNSLTTNKWQLVRNLAETVLRNVPQWPR